MAKVRKSDARGQHGPFEGRLKVTVNETMATQWPSGIGGEDQVMVFVPLSKFESVFSLKTTVSDQLLDECCR